MPDILSTLEPPRPPEGPLDRFTLALTRLSLRHPGKVFLAVCVLAIGSWWFASRLEIRGDFIELLPTRSETAKRFRGTLARKGGSGSTLVVVIQSPDARANQRAVDALETRLRTLPPTLVASVEHGPGAARTFYDRYKWLFAQRRDLALIECELARARARQMPGYLDIDDPCEVVVDQNLKKQPPELAPAPDDADQPKPAAPTPSGKKDSEGTVIQRFERQMHAQSDRLDRFPTGYYRNPAGTRFALMVRSPTAGMGEYSSDTLLHRVEQAVAETPLGQLHPALEVGLTGDIPNAVAERNALVEDIKWVSTLATVLLLSSVVIFFWSFLSLWHMGLCAATGCGVAFAAAMLAYGHLNAATSFLGAIIAGNGINYSILYMARYRERRGLGESVVASILETAVTCRKGTWLATLAVSGAYLSLTLTSFRGFSEFGLIGCTGMLACELVTFTVMPASILLVDRVLTWFARSAKVPTPKPVRAPIAGAVARFGERFPRAILVVAALLCVGAVMPMRQYFQDPWEYDFSKLKSQSSKQRGAGKWSTASDEIFGTRGSPYLMLADDVSQVEDVARQVLARDRLVTGGKFIRKVETVYDALGGTPDEVRIKLELLGKIREHIDKSRRRLSGHDLEVAEQWRPPEYLRPLTPQDLPQLVRERWSELDGRVGTPVYVSLQRDVSQSRGENLLKIADILEGVRLPGGQVVPNASRAAVFAEMIRSMERDGPRATLAAFLVVIAITLLVTRRARVATAVIGSLLCGVVYTVGGAAWINVRLNFLNFIAIPLIFGISVEYAINLYERVRAHGGDITEGVRSAAGAVFECSLTTILGYASLLVADNLALRSFGRYAVAGEIACIGTALVVMPAALHLRGWRKEPARARPEA